MYLIYQILLLLSHFSNLSLVHHYPNGHYLLLSFTNIKNLDPFQFFMKSTYLNPNPLCTETTQHIHLQHSCSYCSSINNIIRSCLFTQENLKLDPSSYKYDLKLFRGNPTIRLQPNSKELTNCKPRQLTYALSWSITDRLPVKNF